MQDPKFLFIVTPPYSGSTALVKILNGSPRSMMLTERGEGQWLVPSLCDQDRWNPDKVVDWPLVKARWLGIYKGVSQLVETVDIVIEKSPPNLVRIEQLVAVFPYSSCFAFNRDPYANCSSILYRHYSTDTLSQEGRKNALEYLARHWLFRSARIIKAIREMSLMHFTYEEFCEGPESCVEKVINICPELDSIDCSRVFQVKDYPVQGIVNQNQRQIGRLTNEDIENISEILSRSPEIVRFFNYSIV